MNILRLLRGGTLAFFGAALTVSHPLLVIFATIGGAVADDYFSGKNDNDIAEKSRTEGFEHGVKAGNQEAAKRFIRILEDSDEMKVAAFALGICVAELDGKICDDDRATIQSYMGKVDSQLFSKELKDKYNHILKNKPVFEEIKKEYLDVIDDIYLTELDEYIVIKGIFGKKEKATIKEIDFYTKHWLPYIEGRCGAVYSNGNNTTEQIFRMAWRYEHGEEIIKNEEEAAFLYKTAARMGHELAKNRLMFLESLAAKTKKLNDEEAKGFYEKGYCYEHGVGDKIDKELALQMYRKAAEAGYKLAKESLERLECNYSYENYFYYNKQKKVLKKPEVLCELILSKEEALNGVIKKVTFSKELKCDCCNGTGVVMGTTEQICTGCNGVGIIKKDEWLKINIPAGVKDGSKLRVANQKAKEKLDADLFITVKVK